MFKQNKYYYGVSFPSEFVNNWTRIDAKKDTEGNAFVEWQGVNSLFSKKRELKAVEKCKEFIKLNLPIVMYDPNTSNLSTEEFFSRLANNLEFYKLMEKTNGQGLWKEINNEIETGDFVSVFYPKFDRVNQSRQDQIFNYNHLQSEEFTTLKDYKIMKLLVPYLQKYICIKASLYPENVKVNVVYTNFGWKFVIKITTLLTWLYKDEILNFKSIFDKDLITSHDLTTFYNDYLECFKQDKSLFSYYGYKSGLVQEIYDFNVEKINEEVTNFYNTYLTKDWEYL